MVLLRNFIIENVEAVDWNFRVPDQIDFFGSICRLFEMLSCFPVIGVFLLFCGFITLFIYFINCVWRRITYNDDHWQRDALVVDDLLIGIPQPNLNGFIAQSTHDYQFGVYEFADLIGIWTPISRCRENSFLQAIVISVSSYLHHDKVFTKILSLQFLSGTLEHRLNSILSLLKRCTHGAGTVYKN